MMGAGGGRRLSLEEFSAPCCGIRFSLAQRLALDAGGLPRSLQLGVKELGGCSLWARSNQDFSGFQTWLGTGLNPAWLETMWAFRENKMK